MSYSFISGVVLVTVWSAFFSWKFNFSQPRFVFETPHPAAMAHKSKKADPPALPDYPCVEGGIWTPIPPERKPTSDNRMSFADVNQDEADRLDADGTLTFHAVGCSGNGDDLEPGAFVAKAMAAQVQEPRVFGGLKSAQSPSFLFHLGDIVYKAEEKQDKQKVGKDQGPLYSAEFYNQFAPYASEIFAIPGNHDSKTSKVAGDDGTSPIHNFLEHFCASKRTLSRDNKSDKRATMNQPYPYWLLDTPCAYIIGLATNDINGGQLDDPMEGDEPQYGWLIKTLTTIREEATDKAIILALHYPPFSGAANFAQRGDPNLSPTPRPNPRIRVLKPLGVLLQHAYVQTNVFPDLVMSAHVHSYQRLTYTMASGRQIPHLICGSGGHGPIEKLSTTCWGEKCKITKHLRLPSGLHLPVDDKVTLTACDDKHFGFLRITVNTKAKTIAGEFFAVHDINEGKGRKNIEVKDFFVLDTASHRVNNE